MNSLNMRAIRKLYKRRASTLGLVLVVWSASTWAWSWPTSAQRGAPCDNARFNKDRAAFAAGSRYADTLEDVCGTVVRVYGKRRTRSGWHGYFLLELDDGSIVRIVSDLDRMNAPPWPWVANGDKVSVRGRYYYDHARRQGIDWTHHGVGAHWNTPGYVAVNGRQYE